MDQPLPKKVYELRAEPLFSVIAITVTDTRLMDGIADLTFVDEIKTELPRHYRVYINPNWDLDEVAAWLKTYLDAKNEKLANS